MEHAAFTKEDIVDVLNVGIEELIRLRYELPKFDRLLRQAYKARKNTNTSIYTTVYVMTTNPMKYGGLKGDSLLLVKLVVGGFVLGILRQQSPI